MSTERRWCIQVRPPRAQRYADVYRICSAVEAIAKWASVCGHVRAGATSRCGVGRLVDPAGVVREQVDFDQLRWKGRGERAGR